MKVISLIGKEEQVLVDAAERMAEEFKEKEIKLGVFLQKNERHVEDTPYHGCVTRYDNKTFFEVGEAFELDSLMSVCCCDILIMINLELPNIPKVLHGPIEKTYKISDDILCILDEESHDYKTITTPVFNYKEEVKSLVSYIWRNGVEMISNKNIQLTEEFIKYADTARKNVAVVKIKSQYGYEMDCIKKTFRSEESAHQEAFFAGILNSTVKIYP